MLQVYYKDLCRKKFIPLKILFFLLFGGTSVLFPFLTIQARSLGITEFELGVIYSLLPIIGITIPPISGMIADKIGNFKIFMSCCFLCSGLAGLLYICIPAGRIRHDMPANLPLEFSCGHNYSQVMVSSPYDCDVKDNATGSLILQDCFYACDVLYGSNSTTVKKSYVTIIEEIELQLKEVSNLKEVDVHSTLWPKVTDSLPDGGRNCLIDCDALIKSEEICKNTYTIEEINPRSTVIIYGTVRILNGLTLASSMPLFEGAAIAIINEHNGDFGLQRVFANLGMIVLTPISGKLIDIFSKINGKEDFRPMFFLYCLLKVLCGLTIAFVDLDFKKPSATVVKDLKNLIKNSRVIAFLTVALVAGISYGFVETFLFWLLEDLNANKSMMGITVTVGAAMGIPVLIYATPITNKLGHVNVICLALLTFFIRFLGYSFITNPWLAMPFEMLECVTVSLLSVAAMSYTALLSTKKSVVSLQGLYGGIYHGIGRGLGSLVGGVLIREIGTRNAFRVLGSCCALTSIIYCVINLLCFKNDDHVHTEIEKDTHKNSHLTKELLSEDSGTNCKIKINE